MSKHFGEKTLDVRTQQGIPCWIHSESGGASNAQQMQKWQKQISLVEKAVTHTKMSREFVVIRADTGVCVL